MTEERTVSAALEDTAGKSVRVRLDDGSEVTGQLGEVEDGTVAVGDEEVDVDAIEDVIVDVRSADPE